MIEVTINEDSLFIISALKHNENLSSPMITRIVQQPILLTYTFQNIPIYQVEHYLNFEAKIMVNVEATIAKEKLPLKEWWVRRDFEPLL
jgi:hypothetical protein